jgi:hypothetical protein
MSPLGERFIVMLVPGLATAGGLYGYLVNSPPWFIAVMSGFAVTAALNAAAPSGK